MIRQLTIEEMVSIQEKLNDTMYPEWRTELTHADYNIAMLSEIGELLDSGRRYKWWSDKSDPHVFNEYIEVIDILHFYLSQISIDGDIYDRDYILGYTDEKTTHVSLINDDGSFNRKTFNMLVYNLMYTKPMPRAIDDLVVYYGMTPEFVSALYVAKATLNEVRMSSGYKNGTYVKVVNGLEDNHRLITIIDAFEEDDSLTLDDVRESVKREFFTNI